MKAANKKGFTLLEVLVAMSVLAIGMLTLIKVSNQATIQTGYLKDKTLAQWVAINKINEIKIDTNWPDKGSTSGSVTMANRDWYWKLKVTDHGPQNQRIRKLKIAVRLEDKSDDALVSFVAFVTN